MRNINNTLKIPVISLFLIALISNIQLHSVTLCFNTVSSVITPCITLLTPILTKWHRERHTQSERNEPLLKSKQRFKPMLLVLTL